MGQHNGVAAFISNIQESIYLCGCSCQLMHIAAENACKQLPVALDEVIIDIFYFLDKSSKCHQELQKFQLLWIMR